MKKISLNVYTGYKRILKIDGKYYSPYTGMEYKIGLVKGRKIVNSLKLPLNEWYKHSLCPCSFLEYEKEMRKRTSVFMHASGLNTVNFQGGTFSGWEGLKRDYSEFLINVRMTIGKDLMVGESSTYGIIAGKEILHIEEI